MEIKISLWEKKGNVSIKLEMGEKTKRKNGGSIEIIFQKHLTELHHSTSYDDMERTFRYPALLLFGF